MRNKKFSTPASKLPDIESNVFQALEQGRTERRSFHYRAVYNLFARSVGDFAEAFLNQAQFGEPLFELGRTSI